MRSASKDNDYLYDATPEDHSKASLGLGRVTQSECRLRSGLE